MNELVLLKKRLGWTAVQDVVIAVVVLAMSMAVIAGAFMPGTTGNRVFMGVLGLVFLWVAWVMIGSARAAWPAEASVIYRELTGDAQGIGWAHLTVGKTNSLKVYFLDGTLCTVYCNRRDGQMLLSFIQQRAPQALFGWGADQQKEYSARVDQRRGSALHKS